MEDRSTCLGIFQSFSSSSATGRKVTKHATKRINTRQGIWTRLTGVAAVAIVKVHQAHGFSNVVDRFGTVSGNATTSVVYSKYPTAKASSDKPMIVEIGKPT